MSLGAHCISRRLCTALLFLSTLLPALAQWPTLRGNVQRTGFIEGPFEAPLHLAWTAIFRDERIGTAVEPIVFNHIVFVATHAGNLHALSAESGEPLWHFRAHGPFLHSPAIAGPQLIAGCADGFLYALNARDGKLRWSLYAGAGGFSASPAVSDGMVFIGNRAGDFLAVDSQSGEQIWRASLNAPIRQTAAFAHGSVFVTSEDLRVHCFDAASGRLTWVSKQLTGQTARDYYPVVVTSANRSYVLVRSNPLFGMSQQIGRDRQLLCRNAGVDDSGWQKVDAWTKSDAARGNPILWQREQDVIREHLQTHRLARTFFVFDCQTGQEPFLAPILWAAGCQAPPAPPPLTRDNHLFVFYRTAYGNWNRGVAPLVGLGSLQLSSNRLAPFFHQNGNQPAWNAFWGTADESQNFNICGDTALIVHQGTLSAFQMPSGELLTLWGERDSFAGFPSPAWARNEWHGPARSGLAIDGRRVFWISGSRVIALASGPKLAAPTDRTVDSSSLICSVPPPPLASQTELRSRLQTMVQEFLSRRWAPLFVEPGLAGRDFSFDDSGDVFAALAWSYPHLPNDLQSRVQKFLATEWKQHPPVSPQSWYSLKEGARREFFWTADELWSRAAADLPHHPFGNCHAIWLFATRCKAWPVVENSWDEIKKAFDSFLVSGWRLDAAKGDLYANRYLASFSAFAAMADHMNDTDAAELARLRAADTFQELAAWWKRAASAGTLKSFNGSAELDPFIIRGDALSFRIAPHRHKVALLLDLTPEIASQLQSAEPAAVETVGNTFNALYRTWHLAGEERQVHYGENFIDPPDLALGGFAALRWLGNASTDDLVRRIDLPFCKADLNYCLKLSWSLETNSP